jgi:diguanylate cyclase (GGDEF)-like protein/PAS domain S-box-containing protein
MRQSESLALLRAGFADALSDGLLSGEHLFETLAAHTPVGIFLSNSEGGCVYVNARWCELTGLTPDQALGDGWAAALHPDDAERVNREWAEAATHGRDSVVEHRFLRPDGSISWVEGYAAALRDEAGAVIGWVGTCLDLTARREAEQAVTTAAERFRVAFDNAPIGMALVAPGGRWLEVNRTLCEITGYSEAELLERTFLQITHPDDRADSSERRGRQLAGEPQLRIEKRYVRADGKVVLVAVSSTLVRDETGAPSYTVAQIEDVTAQKEAEERFRRAFEDAPIGMALVGLDGRWLQVNRRLCEITGYSEAELLDRTFADITHPDDLGENLAVVGQVVDGTVPGMRHEKRYVRRDGSTVWVRVSSSLVRDVDGAPVNFVSQIEDITDRRRAERTLQHQADHDSLTGLLNRRRLDEELAATVRDVRRGAARAALLLLDLDRFKLVNDTHGHQAGDEVLGAVAGLLRSRLRSSDVIARLGGDEFAAIVFETDADAARHVADELTGALRSTPIVVAGKALAVRASVGIVVLDEDFVGDESDVLIAADRALYEAKSAGRDQVAFAA